MKKATSQKIFINLEEKIVRLKMLMETDNHQKLNKNSRQEKEDNKLNEWSEPINKRRQS